MNTKISEVKNKMPDTNSLVTTTVLTKFGENKNKILDCAKYVITQELNKLAAENFSARLKQANLVSKIIFDNKQILSSPE